MQVIPSKIYKDKQEFFIYNATEEDRNKALKLIQEYNLDAYVSELQEFEDVVGYKTGLYEFNIQVASNLEKFRNIFYKKYFMNQNTKILDILGRVIDAE